MFKQIVTLFRGAAYTATEEFTDRHALLILQQQMRDAASAVTAARRAVAIAIAQNEQEVRQHEKLVARIADLEARTIAAIEMQKDDLAREAAEAIALLEAERDTSDAAQRQFNAEISRLKANVRNAEMKLRELQRGQRLATATDRTQRLRQQVPGSGLATLSEAEETLARLQRRQSQIDVTERVMDELDQANSPSLVVEKLAEAGCGDALKTSADDVIARLSKKAKKRD